MKKVQMLEYISGGRHDGTAWPPAGAALLVPDWEADDLIRGRLARPWPPEWDPTEPEPDAMPEEPAAETPIPVVPPEVSPLAGASEVAADPVQPEPEPEPEPEMPEAPRPSAPKAEWVAHAVACGAGEDEANGMSKAELMEQYGGRA